MPFKISNWTKQTNKQIKWVYAFQFQAGTLTDICIASDY